MHKLFYAAICAALLALPASAQQYDTTQLGTTITTTNSYQQVLPRDDTRHACSIQNNGTHNMSVYFGALTVPTSTLPSGASPFTLAPGGSIYCSLGGDLGAIKAQVNITGTLGDAFTYAWQ